MHSQHPPSYARHQITAQDIAAVTAALQGEWITRGPQVAAFEHAIADYCGAQHAVAFNSGTSALHAAYFAAHLTPYDRVMTTSNTFFGTVCGAVAIGSALQFIDIDPLTGNLDLEKIRFQPLSRGRYVLVPVHFAGAAVDMQKLNSLIETPNAVIIEDGCQAFGASYENGKKVGCCELSDMTVFSFHPAKTITTGEGGMVLTNQEEYAQRLRLFRNNALSEGRVGQATGNFHLTDFQAALGLSQLARADAILAHRKTLVNAYQKELSSFAHVRLLQESPTGQSAHNLLVICVNFEAYHKTREEVMSQLKERGIGTQVHHFPLYRHPVFQDRLEDLIEVFPQMEHYWHQSLTLPLFMEMTGQDVEKNCQVLKEVLQRSAVKHSHGP